MLHINFRACMHGAVIRGIVKLEKLIGHNLDMFIATCNKLLECSIRVVGLQTTDLLHIIHNFCVHTNTF